MKSRKTILLEHINYAVRYIGVVMCWGYSATTWEFIIFTKEGQPGIYPKMTIGLSRQALEVINNNTVEHLGNESGRK